MRLLAIHCSLALMPIIAPASDAVPLRIRRGYPVVENVSINGFGPYRFLVDTGAQSSAILPEVASDLGVQAAYRLDLASISGSRPAGAAIVDRLSVGSRWSAHMELVIDELCAIRRLSREIQGVLGQNYLSKFNYRLDYKNHRLVFDEEAPASGARIPFEWIDRCPAIRAELDGKPFR